MPSSIIDSEMARFFRDQLRAARESAICDAEAFDCVIFAIENLGRFLQPNAVGLKALEACIVDIARRSPLSGATELDHRAVCTPFQTLFDMMREARNDAMHQGAHARHLTSHAISMAIVLEDALATFMNRQVLADFMVPNPVCAKLWQPVRFIRQQMLANSFTFIPVLNENDQWSLISDFSVASFIRTPHPGDRRGALSMSLSIARSSGLEFITATCRPADFHIHALGPLDSKPILITNPSRDNELLGIITAFDML
jgi:hypothetical protein